jgi:hypothetical protein
VPGAAVYGFRQETALGDRRLVRLLNYGWWTVLEPHLTRIYEKETEAASQQARQNLEDENNALLAKLRQMRGQQ